MFWRRSQLHTMGDTSHVDVHVGISIRCAVCDSIYQCALGEIERTQLQHNYPLRIEQAVVGYGRASKEQVSREMSSLLGLEQDLPYDEADAAAVALCHALTSGRGEL